MANTANFGWETPDDTDLVKDGAAAIRTLGSAIDTSMVDLKGGTTGQNLRKNSNTDMDFTWAGDATNTVIDAEGDLLVGDSADTLQRLAIGTTGQVLTVDTTLDGKIKWATAASGGGLTLLETLTLSGSTTTSATIAGTYKHLQIFVKNVYGSAQSQLDVRFNGDTGNNYFTRRFRNVNGTVSATTAAGASRFTDIITFDTSSDLDDRCFAIFNVYRYTDTDITYLDYTCATKETDYRSLTGQLIYNNSAAITSVSFLTSAGTFSGGTAYIYGVA